MNSPKTDGSIKELSVSALDLDEAAEFVVDQLQRLCMATGSRGFTAPVLVSETFELVDGAWTRVFHFEAEFLPEVE